MKLSEFILSPRIISLRGEWKRQEIDKRSVQLLIKFNWEWWSQLFILFYIQDQKSSIKTFGSVKCLSWRENSIVSCISIANPFCYPKPSFYSPEEYFLFTEEVLNGRLCWAVSPHFLSQSQKAQ